MVCKCSERFLCVYKTEFNHILVSDGLLNPWNERLCPENEKNLDRQKGSAKKQIHQNQISEHMGYATDVQIRLEIQKSGKNDFNRNLTVYCCVIKQLVTSDGSDGTQNDPGHPENEWE